MSITLNKQPETTTFDDYLPYFSDRLNRTPKVTTLTEHLGASDPNPVHSFPAVEVYPFYMVWIDKRGEWVGIKFHYMGCDSELDGKTETIETAGPYKLSQRCAELIRQAYKSQVPDEKILYTPPSKLEKISVQK